MNLEQKDTPLKDSDMNPTETQLLADNIALEVEKTLLALSPLQFTPTSLEQFTNHCRALRQRIVCVNSGKYVVCQSAICRATADTLDTVALNTQDLKKKLGIIQARMKKGKASHACQEIVRLTIDNIDDKGMINTDELSSALTKGTLREVLKSLLIVVTAIKILDKFQDDSKRLANPFPQDVRPPGTLKNCSYDIEPVVILSQDKRKTSQ